MNLTELAQEYLEEDENGIALFLQVLAIVLSLGTIMLKYWIFWMIGKAVLGL